MAYVLPITPEGSNLMYHLLSHIVTFINIIKVKRAYIYEIFISIKNNNLNNIFPFISLTHLDGKIERIVM